MRNSPFSDSSSFYAELSHHRTFFVVSSPARPRAPRSVIDIPVVDITASKSSAATIIQSHFRGFCVRRHHPLTHLRSIATARKQLEELQRELEGPDFPLKVRASEKERLRFSENVMAIILRLDAIQGSVEEVRSQRREATKKAVGLHDALDAIMMQKDDKMLILRPQMIVSGPRMRNSKW